MRVAYFSPMPPEASGIADYSALLLPALREHVEVEVVKRGAKRPPRGIDLAVYHIGNNPEAHGWILDALRRTPGLVVLHDFVLHHLVAGVTIGRRDGHGYLDAMERDHGVVGRLLAHGVLDKRLPPLWEARPEDFPLAGEVLSLATGLIVHSRYVEEHARSAGFDGPIARVPHPAWPVPDVAAADVAGGAADRGVRQRQRSRSACRSSSRRSPASASSTPVRGSCSSARRRRGSTSTAGSSASGSAATGSCARGSWTSGGSGR